MCRYDEIFDGHVFERYYGGNSIEVFLKIHHNKCKMIEYQYSGSEWFEKESFNHSYDLPALFAGGAGLDNCIDHGLAVPEILDMLNVPDDI